MMENRGFALRGSASCLASPGRGRRPRLHRALDVSRASLQARPIGVLIESDADRGVFPSNPLFSTKTKTRPMDGFSLVENRGFEPLTYRLRIYLITYTTMDYSCKVLV